MKLPASFFTRSDVVQISKELLGKYLITEIGGSRSIGKIVETEAYRGEDDKACHAYKNKRTSRTQIMFQEGGHIYVYLIYGIHHLFNIVTGTIDEANAVLIRAIEPIENTSLMLERRTMKTLKPQLSAGPGVMTKAMGIHLSHNGLYMYDDKTPIWIEDAGIVLAEDQTIASPRVNINYAEECVAWPWRFRIKDNKWTSRAQ